MAVAILETPRLLRFNGEGGCLILTRERIGDAIELLVALLDIAGGHADDEADEDEAVDDQPCDAEAEDGL